MNANLEGKSYNDADCRDWSEDIATEVREKIKSDLNVPRYKIVVQASIGEMKDQIGRINEATTANQLVMKDLLVRVAQFESRLEDVEDERGTETEDAEDALVADLRRSIQGTRSTLVGVYPDLRKNV